jgi:hypothetical protein
MDSILNYLTKSNMNKLCDKHIKKKMFSSREFKVDSYHEEKSNKNIFVIYKLCNLITYSLVFFSIFYIIYFSLC